MQQLHIETNSIKLINAIVNISWTDSIELVTSYDNILNHLGRIFQRLINIGLEKFDELKKKR